MKQQSNAPAAPPHLFDSALWHRRRQNHAVRWAAGKISPHPLFIHAAKTITARLGELRAEQGASLDLGWHGGLLAQHLPSPLVHADYSARMAHLCKTGHAVAVEGERLPFTEGSFACITSLLFLHWLNDLPGALLLLRRALKPGGLFLAALWGSETLRELRQAWLEAQSNCTGAVSPIIAPFGDVQSYGDLLGRAGFIRPVADRDIIECAYPDLLSLLRDLQQMGEGNVLATQHRRALRRDVLAQAQKLYAKKFPAANRGIKARFEIIYLTGFVPETS